MLCFFDIAREGVSWVVANAPASEEYTATIGTVPELLAASASALALVSHNAGRKLASLAKIDARFAARNVIELQQSADPVRAATEYFAADTELVPGVRLSAEQWAVSTSVDAGFNVVCRAVAGAGKTTTLKLCALRAPHRTNLLLTYSKRLQVEVATGAPRNMTALTYHSAAGRAYGSTVRNDEQFRRCVAFAPENPPKFDTLLVDEAQDMTVEYFALVRHFLAANPAAALVVVGDERQSINEYRGAHPAFLTEAVALYVGSDRPWRECRLSVSYRLTPATAAFVNTHMYGQPVITGGNVRDANLLPVYMAVSKKDNVAPACAKALAAGIRRYGPSGVFVLAPSVRGLANKKSPIATLVREHLSNIPTYVAGSDDEIVDEALIRGKVAIMSFNAVKGCERPYVIIVGLDESYFQFFERSWKEVATIPNILTVAATRARARLVVVAVASKTLRTIDTDSLSECAAVIGTPATARAKRPVKQKPRTASVTNFIRHIHPDVVKAALDLVVVTAGAEFARLVPNVVGHIRFGEIVEDVRFVYGILGPVAAELARTGDTSYGRGVDSPVVLASVAAVAARESADPQGFYIDRDTYRTFPAPFWENLSLAMASDPVDRNPTDWTAIAIAKHAFHEGRYHIARQISNYTWVDVAVIDAARDATLQAIAGVKGTFEEITPIVKVQSGNTIIKLFGRMDFVESGGEVRVWEFKLAELVGEHVLQLACYLALRGGGSGVLTSILTGETRNVFVDPAVATQLLETIVAKVPPARTSVFELVRKFDARDGAPDDADVVFADDDAVNFDFDDVF